MLSNSFCLRSSGSYIICIDTSRIDGTPEAEAFQSLDIHVSKCVHRCWWSAHYGCYSQVAIGIPVAPHIRLYPTLTPALEYLAAAQHLFRSSAFDGEALVFMWLRNSISAIALLPLFFSPLHVVFIREDLMFVTIFVSYLPWYIFSISCSISVLHYFSLLVATQIGGHIHIMWQVLIAPSHYGSCLGRHFIARRVSHFLPSPTRVKLRRLTLQEAL